MATALSAEYDQAAILARVFEPRGRDLPPEAARFLLTLQFPPTDQQRLDALAAKARVGTLADEEQTELEHFCRAGDLLAIIHSHARLALARAGEP
jgi:hypothetical protein